MTNKRFEGLRAIVTGAASGIGRATVELFLAEGARVGAIDREPLDAETAVGAVHLLADVSDGDAVTQAVEDFARASGGIDILVNNAGVGAVGTVEDGSDEDWRVVFEVNVFGTRRVSQAVLPHLRSSDHGSIVNVSSALAHIGVRNRACYAASKGAVLALTLAMAADLLSDRIRVNCVTPGTADTPWVARLLVSADDPAAARTSLEERQPMGRLGGAHEIAEAIAFLAAPSSSFVTGTALSVDGGMSGLRV